MNVCPLHGAGIANSQNPTSVAMAPTLAMRDKVLRVLRQLSMINARAGKMQRKFREMKGKDLLPFRC